MAGKHGAYHRWSKKPLVEQKARNFVASPINCMTQKVDLTPHTTQGQDLIA